MKRALLMALCAFLSLNLVGSATAVPLFSKHFTKMYVDEKKNKDYAAKVKAEKCNLCHYGKSKKNRNDYGAALSKLLDKNKYKTSRVKAEAKKVEEELNAAFKKVAEMKNKAGKAYGDLVD